MVTEAIHGFCHMANLARFILVLVSSFRMLLISLIRMVMPPFAELLEFQEMIKRQSISHAEDSRKESNPIIVSALRNPKLPSAERRIDRLIDEGTIVIFAGTETTSRALSVGMFYLLSEKVHIQRIREELKALPSKPDQYSTLQLELLPYLTGVVCETFRLSFGPVARLPRVATNEELQYNNFLIPPGTPVSQSSYFVHTDPTIYPNPQSFDPTRWIKAAQEGVPLKKFLVNFTKGSRQCVGIQMAFTETYLTIATLVQTFDMDLYDTTSEDIGIQHIRLIGYPKKAENAGASRGEVRVKVTRKTNAA